MTREQNIKAILECFFFGYKDDIINSATKRILDIVEVEHKWIPVVERLPKEADGTVLVCMPDIFPYNTKEPYPNAVHNQQVCTATRSEHSGNWYFTNGGIGGTSPIAWMSLPEPYKKEN